MKGPWSRWASIWLDTGWSAAHFDGGLILSLTQIDDMPKEAVRRPFSVADLDDHLGPDPMHSTEHERRPEAAPAWRRNRQGHLIGRERPKTLPQPLKLGDGHSRARPAGID